MAPPSRVEREIRTRRWGHHLRGRAFASFEDAEQHVLCWIAFNNHERLHGELDYQTPASVEKQRPYGPPEAGQPTVHSGALVGLG